MDKYSCSAHSRKSPLPYAQLHAAASDSVVQTEFCSIMCVSKPEPSPRTPTAMLTLTLIETLTHVITLILSRALVISILQIVNLVLSCETTINITLTIPYNRPNSYPDYNINTGLRCIYVFQSKIC